MLSIDFKLYATRDSRAPISLRTVVRLAVTSTCILVLAVFGCFAATLTTTQGLSAVISAASAIVVPSSAVLAHSSAFAAYTIPVTVSYHARTSSAGTGSITVKAISDFTATHPSVASGDLSYTCDTAAGFGTKCGTGGITVQTSPATNVVTAMPASSCGSCSSSTPNTVTVTFSLVDNPSAQTGTYTANMLFTISAT